MSQRTLRERVAVACRETGIDDWGAANNEDWPLAPDLPYAISLVMRHSREALSNLAVEHMSEAFFKDYLRLRDDLDRAAEAVMEVLKAHGGQVLQIRNTIEDPDNMPELEDWGNVGVFPHKTAATQAGLGWIGKTALFVSPKHGAAVRLTTVFTDLPLQAGTPVTESQCGKCRVCVDACPVRAGKDVIWTAGVGRDEIYDEKACEAKSYDHPEWNGVCGVCQTVCPYTRKAHA